MTWLLLYFGIAFDCDCTILEALWILGPIVSTTQVWRELAIACSPSYPDGYLQYPLETILNNSQCHLFTNCNSISGTFSNQNRVFVGWTDYQIYIGERNGSTAVVIEYEPANYYFYCWESWDRKVFLIRKSKPMSMANEMVKLSQHFNRYLAAKQQTKESLSEFLKPLLK